MKKIYTTQSGPILEYLQKSLADQGIESVLKDADPAQVSLVERTPLVYWPELWIMDETRAEEATQIIHNLTRPDRPDPSPWTCNNCNEEVEGNFTQCWNCGAPATEKV